MNDFEDPFRLRILKALGTCLEAIGPDTGYEKSMVGRVFRGRDGFGDNDPVPMISILEFPLPAETKPSMSGRNLVSQYDLDLLVQGFVKDDPENPTDPAHLLLAHVKKALVAEKVRRREDMPDPFGMGISREVNGTKIGNCVMGIDVGSGVVRPPGDGVSNKAYFWLTLTVKISEDNAQPFM